MTRWGIVLALLLAATAAFPPGVGSQTNGPADPQQFIPKILAYPDGGGMGRQGSGVYLNGGIRTVRHVVADMARILVNGSLAEPACLDESTDSAVLTGPTGPTLEEDRSGLLSGEMVLVAGWPHGRYAEQWVRVLAWARVVTLETGRTVGPVYILTWTGPRPGGMSGGPVIRRGKVVAVMVAHAGDFIVVVPVSDAKCSVSAP